LLLALVGQPTLTTCLARCHLTGLYPPWWEGRRFEEPGKWYVAGDTGETTRDILQVALYGKIDQPGTGMIPAHLIHHVTRDAHEQIDDVARTW
jgi:hypothetical protein